MGTKLLFVVGVLALFESGLTSPGRQKRDIGDMMLRPGEIKTLMALFSASTLELTEEITPKLMFLQRSGLLDEQQTTKLANALARAKVKVAEVKRKLIAEELLVDNELPTAWALSVLNRFDDPEKAEYERQRSEKRSTMDLDQVSEEDLNALMEKLSDDSAEMLSDEELRKLIQEARRLDKIDLRKLVQIIPKPTADETNELFTKLSSGKLLGENEARNFWLGKMLGNIPEGTVQTHKQAVAKAESLLGSMDATAKAALLAKMVDRTVKTLTSQEVDQLMALEKTTDFSKEQQGALYRRLLATITDKMFSMIKIAVVYKDNRKVVMRYIRALVKDGKLSDRVLKRMEEGGMMPNGDMIGDVFTSEAEIPESMGLTEDEKAIVAEIREKLTGVLNFDEMDKDDMKEIIEAYGRMTEEEKDIVVNLKSMASNLTAEQIRRLKPHILDRIPEDLLEEIYGAMTDAMKKVFCSLGLKSKDGVQLYMKLKEFCEYDLATDVGKAEGGDKMRLIKLAMKAQGDKAVITGEDLEDLTRQKAINKEVLEKVPDDELKENEEAIKVAVANGLGKVVAEKMRKTTGGLAAMTEADLRRMQGVKFTTSDIKEFNKTALSKAAGPMLDGLSGDDDAAVRSAIRDAIETILPEDFNSADVKVLANFIHAGGNVLDVLNADKKKEVIKKLADRELTKRIRAKVVKSVESMEAFSADRLTRENMNELKEILKDMVSDLSTTFLKKFPQDVLKEFLFRGLTKSVKKMEKPKARAYAKSLGDMQPTKANLLEVGPAVVSEMPTGVFNAMSEATAKDPEIVSMVKEMAVNLGRVVMKTIYGKMKSGIGSEVPLCSIGKMAKDISTRQARAWENIIDHIISSDEECESDNFKPSVLAVLATKMVDKLGNPKDYSEEDKSKLIFLLVLLPYKLIDELPVTEVSIRVIKKMIRDKNLNEKKRILLEKKVKEFYQTSKPTTESEVFDMTAALSDYDVATLLKLVEGQFCGGAVDGMTGMDMKWVEKDRMTGLAQYSLDCETGSTSGPIASEAAVSLYGLICFIPHNRVDDLTTEAFDDTIDQIQQCPFDMKDLEAFKAKALDGLPSLTDITAEQARKILFLLGILDISVVKEMPRAVRSEILREVTSGQDQREKKRKEREEELGEKSDRDAIKKKEVEVAVVLVAARVEERRGNRKKRSTEIPIECSDIQDTGRMAIAFSPHELSSLTDDVILECLTTLGGDIDWSMEQKKALATRLKADGIHGADLSQWSSEQIVDAGTLMGGFTVEELGQFPWGTDELSQHGMAPAVWTWEELAAVASKWLSSVKSGDASSITDVELSVIGHFVCGLTISEINQIPISAYQESVADVGEAEGCNEEQARAFAAKAKNLYNDVDTWSTDVILSVNRVLAGLSGMEFSSISVSDLGEISSEVIGILPPNTLSGLTGEQIRAMSSLQARAVTQEQYNAFNPSQREALESITGKKYTTDNSAGIRQISVISGILVVLVTIAMA